MAFRRVFYRWMWLAALVLPAWLLIGWGLFGENGFAILWLLFIAMPSVFLGELFLGLLTRSRPSVAASGAVSWLDVLGFSVWHLLTIAVVIVPAQWFAVTLLSAIAVGLAMFWLQFRQLRAEAGTMRFRAAPGDSGKGRNGGDDEGDEFVIHEIDPER